MINRKVFFQGLKSLKGSRSPAIPLAACFIALARVIDVFDGNGAPSGPNYLLFSDVDRLADALWDRSGVG